MVNRCRRVIRVDETVSSQYRGIYKYRCRVKTHQDPTSLSEVLCNGGIVKMQDTTSERSVGDFFSLEHVRQNVLPFVYQRTVDGAIHSPMIKIPPTSLCLLSTPKGWWFTVLGSLPEETESSFCWPVPDILLHVHPYGPYFVCDSDYILMLS